MYPSFALGRHGTVAPGSLGFKEGDVIRVEGGWKKATAPGQKGTVAPFPSDAGPPSAPASASVLWHGTNCSNQRKGYFPARLVEISRGALSDDELGELRPTFDAADRNSDNKISLDECHQALKDIGQAVPKKSVKGLMLAAGGSNGSVDFDQFCMVLRLGREGKQRAATGIQNSAAVKVQRAVRAWMWSLTMPPVIAGPSLIAWAKVWVEKGDAGTPSELIERALAEQEPIRAKQWEKLNAKNDARRASQKRKSKAAAQQADDDAEGSAVNAFLKDLLLDTLQHMAVELAHDALDLEPPQDVASNTLNDTGVAATEVDATPRTLKRRKSSYKTKARAKLAGIISKSKLLTKDDKRIARDLVEQVKTKQDRALFLCALLTRTSVNGRTPLLDSALQASKRNKAMSFDDIAKQQYRSVIEQCDKIRDVSKRSALQAIDAIDNHELAGDILEALLDGASPYTMLALANVGQSSDAAAGASDANQSSTGRGRAGGAGGAGGPNAGDNAPTDYGDADDPAPPKVIAAIRDAIKDRKKCTLSYGQHCAAVYAVKSINTLVQAVQLILTLILDEEGGVIRSAAFVKAPANIWTDREKQGFIRFIKNNGALSERQLPAAVRAVENSALKTKVASLLQMLVVKAVMHPDHAAAVDASKTSRASSLGKAPVATDPSAKCTLADRDAATFSIQSNEKVTRDQKHAFKMEIKKAKSMADIFILLNCVLQNDTPGVILTALAKASDESRLMANQKAAAEASLGSTEIISNRASMAAAVETVQKESCNTSKMLVAVCEATISGKLPKDIAESLACITDGDKVALLSMLNSTFL